MRDIKVLSTKKLTPFQREIISNTNISIVAYDAISIEKLPFTNEVVIENAIVTSQNSAKTLIKSIAQLKNVFCVGEKTAALLIENNYNVVKTAKNASELAVFIVKTHKNDSFVFFCGNKRRDELPRILSENKVEFTEEILYKTTLVSQKFDKKFNAILFFSPSGVESFVQENSLKNSVVFCIGNTTAYEAKKHTSNIVVASQATIEYTIDGLIRYFKS
jgi:uroporphyrinogen-III synthase